MAFSRIGMFLYGFFLPSFDCLVVITESLKLDLTSKYNLSDETFLVLPDAADFKEYKPQQIMHNSKLTIGYVGSFYSGRGINLILEMAKRLSEYQFVLVGATDDFINKNFEFLNLKNLEIIKYVPNSMLGVYYDKFDIVVAPYERIIKSKEKAPDTSKWASPLKIFEYMSYSKCILASNLPVFGEVLIDGHNCILCEPNNLIDWIDKIRLLEKSPDLRSNLARNAYQDFNQNYTWDIRAKKLLDHLNKLEIVFK
jgi:glycosyltransferase involved in cell wall biosynthesis